MGASTCTAASRRGQFQRSFVLAEGIEVRTAALDNGLLHIELERELPEPQARNIKIEAVGGKKKAAAPKTIDVSPDGKNGSS